MAELTVIELCNADKVGTSALIKWKDWAQEMRLRKITAGEIKAVSVLDIAIAIINIEIGNRVKQTTYNSEIKALKK